MILQRKSDLVGALASGLCLVHCAATPFIFVAQAGKSACCETVPVWWGVIDYLSIGISVFAVFGSAKTTTKQWMRYALWISWLTMLLVILNEKLAWTSLSEAFIYYPALALVILHLCNQKYCQCNENNCCITNQNETV
ncbi:MerC domain-containing protein [Fulvivirgaceae bacterium BMA10]|uniref:MerC domain-containing protein n=1 Tax=Splendidivirga corallicola TaxID=3051826 RepID=A0ABT8KLT5_9BACT|nr:MerC domain-containing protein [Fulvivirgaceae bacterium BMA10]